MTVSGVYAWSGPPAGSLVCAARNPGLLIYKDELNAWGKRSDVDLHLTVDKRDANWKGKEGLMTALCRDVPKFRKCGCSDLWPSGDDRLYPAGFSESGIFDREYLYVPRSQDEVRYRQMRPLQYRRQAYLQRRAVFLQAELDRLPQEH